MSHTPAGRTHRAAMADASARDPAYQAAVERYLPYERIARLVISLRMELDITQDELARRVGTSASAIARLETGSHHPSVETLRRVAHAMHRDLVIGFRPSAPAGQHTIGDEPTAAPPEDRHLVLV